MNTYIFDTIDHLMVGRGATSRLSSTFSHARNHDGWLTRVCPPVRSLLLVRRSEILQLNVQPLSKHAQVDRRNPLTGSSIYPSAVFIGPQSCLIIYVLRPSHHYGLTDLLSVSSWISLGGCSTSGFCALLHTVTIHIYPR
ncbi:hypothetical protein BDN67DRAFT_709369 [Paxillus ammoniavirescens]|nr:hypothetical protein BDN67DRAFT_709369 [Paxillus ammoniavirescens]